MNFFASTTTQNKMEPAVCILIRRCNSAIAFIGSMSHSLAF